MDFDITNGDIQKASELAAQISALTLTAARRLPTYRGDWRNAGISGIKFRNKTVLEFGFGGTSLKRLLAVRSRTGWEHIWYRNNNHMGNYGYVRVCTIAAAPVNNRAYVGYASHPVTGRGAPRVGWYFSVDLQRWTHWQDGIPGGAAYARGQLNI